MLYCNNMLVSKPELWFESQCAQYLGLCTRVALPSMMSAALMPISGEYHKSLNATYQADTDKRMGCNVGISQLSLLHKWRSKKVFSFGWFIFSVVNFQHKRQLQEFFDKIFSEMKSYNLVYESLKIVFNSCQIRNFCDNMSEPSTNNDSLIMLYIQNTDESSDFDAEWMLKLHLDILKNKKHKGQSTKQYWPNFFKFADNVCQSTVTSEDVCAQMQRKKYACGRKRNQKAPEVRKCMYTIAGNPPNKERKVRIVQSLGAIKKKNLKFFLEMKQQNAAVPMLFLTNSALL